MPGALLHRLRLAAERAGRVEALLAQQAADHRTGAADATPAVQVERLAGADRLVNRVERGAHQGRGRHIEIGNRVASMRNANAPGRGAFKQHRDVGRRSRVFGGQVDEPLDADIEKRVDPGDTLRGSDGSRVLTSKQPPEDQPDLTRVALPE